MSSKRSCIFPPYLHFGRSIAFRPYNSLINKRFQVHVHLLGLLFLCILTGLLPMYCFSIFRFLLKETSRWAIVNLTSLKSFYIHIYIYTYLQLAFQIVLLAVLVPVFSLLLERPRSLSLPETPWRCSSAKRHEKNSCARAFRRLPERIAITKKVLVARCDWRSFRPRPEEEALALTAPQRRRPQQVSVPSTD